MVQIKLSFGSRNWFVLHPLMFKMRSGRNNMHPSLWCVLWQKSAKVWIVLVWSYLWVCQLLFFSYIIRSYEISIFSKGPFHSVPLHISKRSTVSFELGYWIICEWSSNHLPFVFLGQNENSDICILLNPTILQQHLVRVCSPSVPCPPILASFPRAPGCWQLVSWPADPPCKGHFRERWDRLGSEQCPRAAALKQVNIYLFFFF